MAQKLIPQDLGLEYVTRLKSTKLTGVHANVMGMDGSTQGSKYQ